MKQVLQDLSKGETTLADVPCPQLRPGHLLIGSTVSLISAGTERMLVEFGRGSVLAKVLQQPEKARQVLAKASTDGIASTVRAVRSRLDEPLAPGYCSVGRVLAVGAGVDGFAVGDRVVSNGSHAEVVLVPRHLCALIPDRVDDETAAFTVLGAIALQGVRLAQPTLGESVAVFGLGLVGLMAAQILAANGCRVIGFDLDRSRLDLAGELGIDQCVELGQGADPVAAAQAFSRGRGIDAVLLTASTRSSEPVSQAARMCRKRGRIVLVGMTGLELSRADFYEKELSFQVSCSYGPGRYDPAYEEHGHDYPVGFVRWTEQRNFEAVLDLIANASLGVRPLITHRFPIEDAAQAYELLVSDRPSLGILLRYSSDQDRSGELLRSRLTIAAEPQPRSRSSAPALGFLGAGNHASRVLIPAFSKAGATMHTVVSMRGVSAAHQGARHGFRVVSSDAAAVFDSPEIDAVVVATRHDSHAGYVCQALRAGKHVYVEKPLALRPEEVDAIEAAVGVARPATRSGPLLQVGFNRRFAPQVQTIRRLLAATPGAKAMVITVNAGELPASHWTQDPESGGGRIVGEACHFVDLLRYLAGAAIIDYHARGIRRDGRVDSASMTFSFADGSIGTVHYFSNGHRAFPKERVEVFAAGRILQLDNFRRLRAFGWPGFSGERLWAQDKGRAACARSFVEAIRSGGDAPIPVPELIEVARVTIAVADSLAA